MGTHRIILYTSLYIVEDKIYSIIRKAAIL